MKIRHIKRYFTDISQIYNIIDIFKYLVNIVRQAYNRYEIPFKDL